jgi:DNA-binding LacI/PurR family transcriptional regulator
MIGRPLHLEEYTSFVAVDNVQAARQIVHHLISLNRRRIATITGSMENIDGQDRLLGSKIALESAGIPFDPNLVIEGRFNREAGYMCMKQLLSKDVDAVFAASDIVAVGAMQAIHDAGLIVPDDIAVVGFDDLPTALQTKPQLTTVRQPVSQKGAQATSLLLDFVEGIIEGPVQKLLPTQLVIRQSCGADYK